MNDKSKAMNLTEIADELRKGIKTPNKIIYELVVYLVKLQQPWITLHQMLSIEGEESSHLNTSLSGLYY